MVMQHNRLSRWSGQLCNHVSVKGPPKLNHLAVSCKQYTPTLVSEALINNGNLKISTMSAKGPCISWCLREYSSAIRYIGKISMIVI